VQLWDHMVFDIAQLHTYLKVAQILELCKKYWGTHPLQLLRYIPMYRQSGCSQLTNKPIPERN
jgi:hypothetical protein